MSRPRHTDNVVVVDHLKINVQELTISERAFVELMHSKMFIPVLDWLIANYLPFFDIFSIRLLEKNVKKHFATIPVHRALLIDFSIEDSNQQEMEFNATVELIHSEQQHIYDR